MDPPPLPDGVLVQSTYVDSEGQEAGWRVWADGRHEGRRAAEDWQAGPAIDAAGMDEIARILDDEDVSAMEGVHRRDTETEHTSTHWFQVAREGGPPVTVALVDGARLDGLDRLVARLAPVLSGGALG